MRSVEEILDKIKELRGIPPGHGSDVALAKSTKLRKQAITNWRYRNQVAWKSLMKVLSQEEFHSVYYWASGKEVSLPSTSAGPPRISPPDGKALSAARKIVEELIVEGRKVNEDILSDLVALVAEELVTLKAQGRESEIRQKVRRWVNAAQSLGPR